VGPARSVRAVPGAAPLTADQKGAGVMLDAFSHQQWRLTVILFVVCIVTAAAGAIVGIDDNLPGLFLVMVSAVVFVLAFVHPWRTTRRFILLIGASLGAFVVFTVLHNVLGDVSPAGAAFFYLAIFLCPAGMLVGIVGTLVSLFTGRRGHGARTTGHVA
jgi:hypothetical protein